MSVTVIVNGNEYQYPTSRDSPSWGGEATDWAIAVSSVLNTLQGTDDIITTTALINNNQTSPQAVVGLNFDPNAARGAIVTYSVNRFTDGVGGVERAEVGYMYCNYIVSTNIWNIVVAGSGTAGMSFSMTSLGNIEYTSDNQAGDNYTGTIVFQGKSLPVIV